MKYPWTLYTLEYPPQNGGVARYLADLVKASNGQMQVIVPEGHPVTDDMVRRVKFFGRGLISWWPLVQRMRALPRTETRLLVSHILPIGTAAWIASYLGGPRYTILFHGLDLRLSQRSAWKRWLVRRIVKRAEAIAVNSVFVANECKELFPDREALVLTPGYEPHPLPSKQEARKQLKMSEGERILLIVCRLVTRKGIDRAIEALSAVSSSARLVVIGDGPDRARLEQLAQSFGSRVSLVGALDDRSRDLWYAASDVFVFPVRNEGADIEGYGIVCLEAAAAGLPVIVGQGGGASETVVDGVTGLVADAEQPGTLAEAINTVLEDDTLRHAMGERGRERVLAEGRWIDRWKKLESIK